MAVNNYYLKLANTQPYKSLKKIEAPQLLKIDTKLTTEESYAKASQPTPKLSSLNLELTADQNYQSSQGEIASLQKKTEVLEGSVDNLEKGVAKQNQDLVELNQRMQVLKTKVNEFVELGEKVEKLAAAPKKNSTVEVDYQKDNLIDFDTEKVTGKGSVITPIGMLEIEFAKTDGTTKAYAPKILPTVDPTAWKSDGSMRENSEPFEAKQYSVGYKVKAPFKDGEIKGGLKVGEYEGETQKEAGLDSKDLNVFSFGGGVGFENADYSIFGQGKRTSSDVRVGFLGYDVLIDNTEDQYNLEGRYHLSDNISLDLGVDVKTTQKDLSFKPKVFPSNVGKADLVTIKPGVTLRDEAQDKAVSTGLIINTGEEIGSIIPYELDGNSLGAYVAAKFSKDLSASVAYSKLKGSGTDSYLTKNNDLTEAMDQDKWEVSAKYKNWEFEAGYTHLDKSAGFSEAGPWTPLLLAYPNQVSPSYSTWQEDQKSIAVKYKMDNGLTLGTSYQENDVNFNQHGLERPEAKERIWQIGISGSF